MGKNAQMLVGLWFLSILYDARVVHTQNRRQQHSMLLYITCQKHDFKRQLYVFVQRASQVMWCTIYHFVVVVQGCENYYYVCWECVISLFVFFFGFLALILVFFSFIRFVFVVFFFFHSNNNVINASCARLIHTIRNDNVVCIFTIFFINAGRKLKN